MTTEQFDKIGQSASEINEALSSWADRITLSFSLLLLIRSIGNGIFLFSGKEKFLSPSGVRQVLECSRNIGPR